jgi:hypothetical protein
MRVIPRKNCIVGFIGFLIAAVLSGGAAILHAKSGRDGLVVVYLSITLLNVGMSAFFFKKSKQASA